MGVLLLYSCNRILGVSDDSDDVVGDCTSNEVRMFNYIKELEVKYNENKSYENCVEYKKAMEDYNNLNCANEKSKRDFEEILKNLPCK